MTAFSTPCWRNLLSAAWLACVAPLALAVGIEPERAALVPTEDGYALSADFSVDLGPRLEDAASRGVPLYLALEFDLTRARWYWSNEHVAARKLVYRLAFNPLTRQYRLSAGGLHQNFGTLAEALRVVSRVIALPVVDKAAVKNGETYNAALRLSLDSSQLPKPLQLDALSNRDWQVETKVLRWQFAPADAK